MKIPGIQINSKIQGQLRIFSYFRKISVCLKAESFLTSIDNAQNIFNISFDFNVQVLIAQAIDPAYALIIKGGQIMDPKNNIEGVMDVAINKEGKIAAVAKNINPKSATRVVNAKGLMVIPGIIDMHTHNFAGVEADRYLRNSYYANMPDGFTFRVGVTTVVDAGSAG